MSKNENKELKSTMEKLKNRAALFGTSAVMFAFAACAPAAEVARRDVSAASQSAAASQNVGVRWMPEYKIKIAGMERFNALAEALGEMKDFGKKNWNDWITTVSRNPTALKHVTEQRTFAIIVNKILTYDVRKESWKNEADSVGLTITPQLEKAIRERFSGMESLLDDYLRSIMLAQAMKGERKLQPLESPSIGTVGETMRQLGGPEFAPYHLFKNADRVVLPTGLPTLGRDQIANYVDPTLSQTDPQTALQQGTANAQLFANAALNGLRYGIERNWDSKVLDKDSGAQALAKQIAGTLDNVKRPELRDNTTFQALRERLRDGKLTALRDLMKQSSDLGMSFVSYLNNLMTMDIQPLGVITRSAQVDVTYVCTGERESTGKVKGGMGEFYEIVRGREKAMGLSILTLFASASFAMQDVLVTTRQFKNVETNPEIIMNRLMGKGRTAEGMIGTSAGFATKGGHPFMITVELAKIGYEEITAPLPKGVSASTTVGGPAISEFKRSGTYVLPISSIDFWYVGQEGTVANKISAHTGIKPQLGVSFTEGQTKGIAEGFVYYVKGGYEWRKGKNTFRFDISPELFVLTNAAERIISNDVVPSSPLKVGPGAKAELTYLRERIRKLGGGDVLVKMVAGYQYLPGEKVHAVELSVPVEWRKQWGKYNSLSFYVAPGYVHIDGNAMDKALKKFSITGGLKIRF